MKHLSLKMAVDLKTLWVYCRLSSFSIVLLALSYSTDLLSLTLVGEEEARNYVRSSFSQTMLSITGT